MQQHSKGRTEILQSKNISDWKQRSLVQSQTTIASKPITLACFVIQNKTDFNDS